MERSLITHVPLLTHVLDPPRKPHLPDDKSQFILPYASSFGTAHVTDPATPHLAPP